jgi:hypothetical protein
MQPLIWKRREGRYVDADEAWIGTVCVGEVGPAIGRQGEKTQYHVVCHLPSIRPKPEYAKRPSVDEAKAVVEGLVSAWFKKLEAE